MHPIKLYHNETFYVCVKLYYTYCTYKLNPMIFSCNKKTQLKILSVSILREKWIKFLFDVGCGI